MLIGVVGGCTIVFAFGLLDDIVHLHPAREARRPVRGRLRRHRTARISVEFFANDIVAVAIGDRSGSSGITNAFNLLDNMDGLAASSAVVACCVLRDRRRVGPRTATSSSSSPRRSASPASASCRTTSASASRRASSWATPAASCSGSGSPARAGGELDGSRHDVATVAAARDRPRDPDPRHDARHDAASALERRPVTQGGKDHTSHRLVYRGLSERRGRRAPRDRRRRARSHEARLRRARQRSHHDDRRARQRASCSSSSATS